MKDNWIKIGYEVFAVSGEESLKVEALAKKMGISKSSFYHHFAEMEIFVNHLLDYHLKQSTVIAQKENNAEKIFPDLITILIEHKMDLLFNRQLRINQQFDSYKRTLLTANQTIGKEFITLCIKDFNSTLTYKQMEGLLELALENFFLQINYDNLHYEWLVDYFDKLKKIAKRFEQPIVR